VTRRCEASGELIQLHIPKNLLTFANHTQLVIHKLPQSGATAPQVCQNWGPNQKSG
jgi:hypothetical protein